MGTKVNFTNIILKDIEGNDQKVDIAKTLGNQLYMQGQNIEECELGRRIYFEGEVEMSDKDVETVTRAVSNYAYVLRTAITDALKA